VATSRAQGNSGNLSPLALEAVRRIDATFAVERTLNGLPMDHRRQFRAAHVAPPVDALEAWIRTERARLSRHNPVAKAMDYMLTRWPAFTCFLADSRISLTNYAAERELRAVALGPKNRTFLGSDRGGERAAAIYILIATAKLNGIDPEALARRRDHVASGLDEFLPWNWTKPGDAGWVPLSRSSAEQSVRQSGQSQALGKCGEIFRGADGEPIREVGEAQGGIEATQIVHDLSCPVLTAR
jgi:hypothetical protein